MPNKKNEDSKLDYALASYGDLLARTISNTIYLDPSQVNKKIFGHGTAFAVALPMKRWSSALWVQNGAISGETGLRMRIVWLATSA